MKIENKEKIKSLRIAGNPIGNIPNSRTIICEIFPNLIQLDDITLTEEFK